MDFLIPNKLCHVDLPIVILLWIGGGIVYYFCTSENSSEHWRQKFSSESGNSLLLKRQIAKLANLTQVPKN